MSIIYKGLNPKHHYGLCILTINGELITANGKHFQAIQIPKGHGDIKDVGKIDIPSTSVDMFENCGNCNLLDDEQVKEIIHNAPTILEAEE